MNELCDLMTSLWCVDVCL